MVGLHDAEVEFAGADAVDVGNAAATGRGVALDLVIGGAAIEEAADGLACDIVDAGLTAGAYYGTGTDRTDFLLYEPCYGCTCAA